MKPKPWVDFQTAAKILGISEDHFARSLRHKVLLPHVRPSKRGRGIVFVADLVDFMRKHGYPREMIRGAFAPPDGKLLWLGRPGSDIVWGDLSRCDPTYCKSALTAGRLMERFPTWGIVINLKTYGYAAGMRVAREVGADEGGPLLIALTCDATQTAKAGRAFDLVIPRPFRSTVAVAKALARLRDSRTTPPGDGRSGGRPHPAGKGAK